MFLEVFATDACLIRQFGELRKTKASSSSVDLFEGGGGSQEWYRHKVTNYYNYIALSILLSCLVLTK